ncbi:hypothetical protein Leryth_021936 [Lithospermum erythrorhizon]|nr:hypothetical protein Leryth_021936 [Lithospermum erythrorhizon]
MSLQGFLKLTLNLPHNHQKPSSTTVSRTVPIISLSNAYQPEYFTSLHNSANQSVAAIVFGDGSHSRLYPLTKRRSEGALPIAGNYRLIDAVVSNCINSNITKIYALTQFNSTSLNSHLSRAYTGAGLGKDGFVEVIAACQSPEGESWFQGTADAVRRCLWVLEDYSVTELLILPGHHLYKMDYQKLIESHRNNKADITVPVISHSIHDNQEFGTFKINAENQVVEFRDTMEQETLKSRHGEYFPKFLGTKDNNFNGMGIYAINRDIMLKLLKEHYPLANDFRTEVIPGAISSGMKVHAYMFDGYWEDMRSIEAYYRANMESINKTDHAFNNFYDRHNPLYTLPRHLPPTLITDANIKDCIIGDGCILNRCNIKGTIIGMRARIGDGTTVKDSIIMGCDTYQTSISQGERTQIPPGIGQNSLIRRSIIDKNARIGKNVKIVNKDNVKELNDEANGYIITGGIVVILRNAVIPDETTI